MFAHPRTFRCPSCNEMVNESMQKCKFCDVPIDHQAALAAAAVQDKANEAYSDASYARTAAVAMWVFLGLSFIPFVPVVGWGFVFTFCVVFGMLVRWQIKFGGLKTADPDSRGRNARGTSRSFCGWSRSRPVSRKRCGNRFGSG